jgi:hypothetical protein
MEALWEEGWVVGAWVISSKVPVAWESKVWDPVDPRWEAVGFLPAEEAGRKEVFREEEIRDALPLERRRGRGSVTASVL